MGRLLCSVAGCSNTDGKKYYFPIKKAVKDIWIQRSGNSRLYEIADHSLSSYFLCACHFDKSRIKANGRLFSDSLPTLNLPCNKDEEDAMPTFFREKISENITTSPKAILKVISGPVEPSRLSPTEDLHVIKPTSVYTRKPNELYDVTNLPSTSSSKDLCEDLSNYTSLLILNSREKEMCTADKRKPSIPNEDEVTVYNIVEPLACVKEEITCNEHEIVFGNSVSNPTRTRLRLSPRIGGDLSDEDLENPRYTGDLSDEDVDNQRYASDLSDEDVNNQRCTGDQIDEDVDNQGYECDMTDKDVVNLRNAKGALKMAQRTVAKERKKIKFLQQQKRRLAREVKCLKDLLLNQQKNLILGDKAGDILMYQSLEEEDSESCAELLESEDNKYSEEFFKHKSPAKMSSSTMLKKRINKRANEVITSDISAGIRQLDEIAQKLVEEKPYDQFGKFVASELSQLPEQQAILIQQEIQNCFIRAKLVPQDQVVVEDGIYTIF